MSNSKEKYSKNLEGVSSLILMLFVKIRPTTDFWFVSYLNLRATRICYEFELPCSPKNIMLCCAMVQLSLLLAQSRWLFMLEYQRVPNLVLLNHSKIYSPPINILHPLNNLIKVIEIASDNFHV